MSVDFLIPFTVVNSGEHVFSKWCLHIIYQTRATVFHRDIQTLRRELKYDAQRSIFDEI